MKNLLSNIILTCSVLLLLGLSTSAFSQQNAKLIESRKKQNAKDIKYTNSLLKKTLRNKKSSMASLRILSKKISARKNLLSSISQQITLLNEDVKDLKFESNRLKRDLAGLKSNYSKIVFYAYKQRNANNKLMFILSSESFNQAFLRYKYLQQFSKFAKSQAGKIQSTQESLELRIVQIKRTMLAKESLLSDHRGEAKKLHSERVQQDDMLSKLRKKESSLRLDLKKQKRIASNLQSQLKKIIKNVARKAGKSKDNKSRFSLTPTEKLLSENFGKNKSKLPWPTETGFISEKFGEHAHPVLKYVKVRNDGIDITTDSRSTCRTVFNGEVTQIVSVPGLNNVVIIRHGEFFTVYSNLEKVLVKNGDIVSSKQAIGTVHTDEDKKETVLKFQLWKGSTKLNPSLWLVHQ